MIFPVKLYMHIPILLDEILDKINLLKPRHIIDCTFGFGGHAERILEGGYKVTAFDQDPTTLPRLELFKKRFEGQFDFIIDNFSNISQYSLNPDFIMADLGMSTMQLDSKRGFSFKEDSPLKMKMSDEGPFLKDLLNRMPAVQITEIIKKFGEEPRARKIASNIDLYRLKNQILTTFDLRKAVGIDEFKVLARVFQAFRIFMNKEIEAIEKLCDFIRNEKLNFCVLTFHSLEDRYFKVLSRRNYEHKGFVLPSTQELERNSKSKSSKLRFAYNFR